MFFAPLFISLPPPHCFNYCQLLSTPWPMMSLSSPLPPSRCCQDKNATLPSPLETWGLGSFSPRPPPSAREPQKQHSSAASLPGGIHRHRKCSAPPHSQSLSPSHNSTGSEVEMLMLAAFHPSTRQTNTLQPCRKKSKTIFQSFLLCWIISPPTSTNTRFPSPQCLQWLILLSIVALSYLKKLETPMQLRFFKRKAKITVSTIKPILPFLLSILHHLANDLVDCWHVVKKITSLNNYTFTRSFNIQEFIRNMTDLKEYSQMLLSARRKFWC